MGAGCFEDFRQSLKQFLQRSEKRKNSTMAACTSKTKVQAAFCRVYSSALTPHFQPGLRRYRVAVLPQHGNQPLAAHQMRRAHGK